MDEDDELALGDLGVDDPDRPLPRRERPQTDWSAEAVERRKANPPPPMPAPDPSAPPAQPAEPHSTLPQWIARVRTWCPPDDLGAEPEPVAMAVAGLIQEAKVGALVAAGGVGKTTMLLTLGICHATARDFLGHKVRPGSFVLLSADDSQEDLEGALGRVVRAMKLTPDEIDAVREKVWVVSLQGEPGTRTFATYAAGAVQSTGMVEFVMQALADIGDLVGIAFDTLRQFAGGASTDEEIIKATIAGAGEIAQLTGAYVVFPHHTGKNNYRDGVTDMYVGSGSAAIADNCRFVLLLQTATWSEIESKVNRTGQERGDPLVLLSTRGSLLMKAPPPIYLHRDGYLLGRIAGAALSVDQIADEEDRAILAAVRAGAQSKNAIAAAVKRNRGKVLRQVDDLIFRGLLSSGSASGTGKLMVSGTGATFLDCTQ